MGNERPVNSPGVVHQRRTPTAQSVTVPYTMNSVLVRGAYLFLWAVRP